MDYAMDNSYWGPTLTPSPDYLQAVGSAWRQVCDQEAA